MPRGRRLVSVVAGLLLAGAVLEIYVIVLVGHLIGAWPTFGLLLAGALIGGWLVRHEGARAARALSLSLRSGRMPGDELADGAVVLVGGGLIVVPGFVSDVVGALILLPVTRPVTRRLFRRVFATTAGRPLGAFATDGHPTTEQAPNARNPGAGPEGPVIRGEVIDDDPDGS